MSWLGGRLAATICGRDIMRALTTQGNGAPVWAACLHLMTQGPNQRQQAGSGWSIALPTALASAHQADSGCAPHLLTALASADKQAPAG